MWNLLFQKSSQNETTPQGDYINLYKIFYPNKMEDTLFRDIKGPKLQHVTLK